MESVSVFDFTITDGGTSDGLSTDVSQIVLHTSGSADFYKMIWLLNGADASDVEGVYSSSADTVTFSSLSISVANGANETYTLSGYYDDTTGLIDNESFGFSIDGDHDITVDTTKSKMAIGQNTLANYNNAIVDVRATKLIFTTQPAPISIEKGVETTFTTVPVIKAVDANGAVDLDFSEFITLSSSDGVFTNGVVKASNGVATFTGLKLTSNSSSSSIKLTANDEDSEGTDLSTVDSNEITVTTTDNDVAPVTPTPASGGSSGGSSYTPPVVTPTPEEEKEKVVKEEEEEEEVVKEEEEKEEVVEEEKVVVQPTVQPIANPIVVARPTGNAEQTGTKPEVDNVTRLYIATFGRAPRSSGSIYWLYESKLNLEDIARSFFDQEETKGKYPEGFSNYDFIVAIYNHVYGRNPDQAGGDYWLEELDNGKIEKALFILAIINGAIGDDALMLGKQTTAGVIFVRSGVESLDLAKKVIDDIKR